MAEELIRCPACNTPLPHATVKAVLRAAASKGGKAGAGKTYPAKARSTEVARQAAFKRWQGKVG